MATVLDRLAEVESFTVEHDINTDDDTPINGHVGFELFSDGGYRFFGHMRATGGTSYHYGLQGWVSTSDGAVIAAQRTGNVYGTDTPGDRQDNFDQSGNNPAIKLNWAALRDQHALGYSMQADIGGVLGTVVDVLEFAVKGIIANVVLGPAGGWCSSAASSATSECGSAPRTSSQGSSRRAACSGCSGRSGSSRRSSPESSWPRSSTSVIAA